jgi:hypothetical protein
MTPSEALKLLAERCDRHTDECLRMYEEMLIEHGATADELEAALGYIGAMYMADKLTKLAQLQHWIDAAIRQRLEALVRTAFRPRQHHHRGGNGSLALAPSQSSF